MEIDIKKIHKKHETIFDISNNYIESSSSLLESLHIIMSTIENWDDEECLMINKKRMNEFLQKFIK